MKSTTRLAPLNVLTRERGASHVKGSLEKTSSLAGRRPAGGSLEKTSTLLGSFGSTELQRKSSKIERFECDKSSNSHLLPSNRHLIFFSHAPKTPYYPEKIWTSMIQDPYFQPSYQHAFYQDGYFYPLF